MCKDEERQSQGENEDGEFHDRNHEARRLRSQINFAALREVMDNYILRSYGVSSWDEYWAKYFDEQAAAIKWLKGE